MTKFILFIITVYKKVTENELPQMANALSFKLILAFFPFIIFLMTLLGYLNINYDSFVNILFSTIPSQADDILNYFFNNVVYAKHITLLSSSLLLSIISSSSGFFSALKSLNRAYGQRDKRNYIVQRFVCVILVLIFAFLITASLIMLIFNDKLCTFFLSKNLFIPIINLLGSYPIYFINIFITFLMISIIYIFAVNKKLSLKDVTPGALFTVVFWLIFSKLFNVYINNFSKFSTIYGGIGSIFILFYWLYLLSLIFLIGGQINAILFVEKRNS